jgi:hypothetical protein
MLVKVFAAAVTTVGAIAAVGVPSGHQAEPPVQQVVFSVPIPQDPPLPQPPGAPTALPTAQELSSLCERVTDPGASYATKVNLVENGITANEGDEADHDLHKAYRNGNFPEQFSVTNIAPAGPNVVTAEVAISGPKFARPVIKNMEFCKEDGTWKVQHNSAIALVQAASATD